jgi:hypothetical protein
MLMPEKETMERAKRDQKQGKAPSTQAGEFVREEIQHIREGKHGAKSSRQAIAIGLSKARRAGVKLPPPARGKATAKTRASAKRTHKKTQAGAGKQASPRRARATRGAYERRRAAASRKSVQRLKKAPAARRSIASAGRRAAVRKAARARANKR